VAIRRSQLQGRHQDSAIGWISFSDTLFFGFGLVLVLGMNISAKLKQRDADLESLTAVVESSQLGESQNGSSVSVAKQLATVQSQLEEKQEELKRLAEEAAQAIATREQLDVLESELKVVRQKLKASEDLATNTEKNEKSVRRELLGLQGKMQRVAIVVDGSESMKQGNRWKKARDTVLQWIECLDMQSCVVILFHSYVYRSPKQGVLDFEDSRQESIEQIRRQLGVVEPQGRTDTLAALEEAYRVPDVDTIILFTDGSPNIDDKPGTDRDLVERIYKLCRSKPGIPINAIGIGNYFAKDLSTFLLTIAEITKGTFIGR